MTEGVVIGGWGYVWAAYAITAGAFLIYGIGLFVKLREERNRAVSEGGVE